MTINEYNAVLLNLPDVTITDFSVEEKRIKISCFVTKQGGQCPKCNAHCVLVNNRTTRELRDLNFSGREVYLLVTVRQFHCPLCNSYHTELLDFADANKSYTRRQAKYVFELCKKQSYAEIATVVNMHPKLVERLVLSECENQERLAERYAQVRRLGIDEQSHRKGKKDFICVMTDLDRGTIVDILSSRKKESLELHFQTLGKTFCDQITDVSCDVWAPYISVAGAYFPNANIVLDRFHVTKLLNESLDDFRKNPRKEYKLREEYKKLKWVLYKQYHRLTDLELDLLEAAFKVNPELKEYYFLREEFHHALDNHDDVASCVSAMDAWTLKIQQKEITIFDGFIKTLQKHKVIIANYVKDRLSNAVTEGLNNLVRSVRRVAFGMPNFKHVRLRALAISS